MDGTGGYTTGTGGYTNIAIIVTSSRVQVAGFNNEADIAMDIKNQPLFLP